MARGVFESVLDLKRSVALREGAMQKLSGVFKRRRPYARRTERQHTRIPVTLPAQLARHGPPPFTFTPCVIEDLSPGGARCQVATSAEELAPGMIVQLKWELPESPGQVIAIARVAHTGAPAVVGLAFLQITEHDADRVMQFGCRVVVLPSHSPPHQHSWWRLICRPQSGRLRELAHE